MYQPMNPADLARISTWEYRKQLIKGRLESLNPDVVCMQEVSPLSFHEDFSFMTEELGYDGVEMFKRGRFRPATFWRREKCQLVAPPVHNDRTLLTAFNLVDDESVGDDRRNWHVLNCHLQAGPEGKRRVRQIDDGISSSNKLAKRMKEKDPTNPLLIICGDFNGGPECGAVHYVTEGQVGPEFIEDGEPVSTKTKKSRIQGLRDTTSVFPIEYSPPTLVVAELISQMVKGGSGAYETPELSKDVSDRLERCYQKFATHNCEGSSNQVMNCDDVKRWLTDINKQVGRGSEFRSAAKEMGWTEPEPTKDEDGIEVKPRIVLPERGILTLQGFQNVYESELRGGKFWGIAHDLWVMGEELPQIGLFEARYDQMYFSSSLHPIAVLDITSDKPCPNEKEPSDHLPVAASFQRVDLN